MHPSRLTLSSAQHAAVFLRDLLLIRLVEERIVELYPQQQMRCPVHLCIGQEAIAVGVSQALTQKDFVLSNHRAHGHYLAKGGDLKAMFAEMYGKAAGCSGGRGGSMHLIDLKVNFLGSTPIVAGAIPVATGVAFAEKMRGSSQITVSYLGDAAVEEGVFHECLNFAVLKKLPMIYVCENNLYSVYTPLKQRQPDRPLSDLAQGHGMKTIKADGNDVFAVYDAAQEAVAYSRAGQGPVFLEFPTYRWREHCGPQFDNHLGYRDPKEFEQWKTFCPVQQMKDFVLQEGLLSESDIQQIQDDLLVKIDEAVTFAKACPMATDSLTPDDAYARS